MQHFDEEKRTSQGITLVLFGWDRIIARGDTQSFCNNERYLFPDDKRFHDWQRNREENVKKVGDLNLKALRKLHSEKVFKLNHQKKLLDILSYVIRKEDTRLFITADGPFIREGITPLYEKLVSKLHEQLESDTGKRVKKEYVLNRLQYGKLTCHSLAYSPSRKEEPVNDINPIIDTLIQFKQSNDPEGLKPEHLISLIHTKSQDIGRDVLGKTFHVLGAILELPLKEQQSIKEIILIDCSDSSNRPTQRGLKKLMKANLIASGIEFKFIKVPEAITDSQHKQARKGFLKAYDSLARLIKSDDNSHSHDRTRSGSGFFIPATDDVEETQNDSQPLQPNQFR